MDYKDYYKILGVKEDAPAAEIKQSFRRLARKYHPDVSKEKDAEAKFKELNEANEVLKDSEKRAEYDQLRKMGTVDGQGHFRPPPGWRSAAGTSDGGYTDTDSAHFSDFFESIFGRGGTAHRTYEAGGQSGFRMRGEDIHHQLPIFLEEAVSGAEQEIEFVVPEIDEYGLVNHRKKHLKVKIPKGILAGQHLRLKGQGAPGIGGGPSGDLFIDIIYAPHPRFVVTGKDLSLALPVSPWEAVLGATIVVPTLQGKVKLKIPPNSQEGAKLRIEGKGLPGDPPGSLIAILKIVMPKQQTEKSRELFEALAEEIPFNPRADLEVG